MELSTQLNSWYEANKRDLPWRHTRDPYTIWLSEIILQQTRVKQGLPYFNAFVNKYPTVRDFAEANEQDILTLWQGLGYYSRARNMHYAAKTVVEKYGDSFPSTYAEIITLKGVGEYTAAAIASFAYNLPHAVLDGNVYRVIARLFDIQKPIDTSEGKKEILHALNQVFDAKNSATFNQAIMEFGALLCVPKKPHCLVCPLQSKCLAFAHNTIDTLPVKAGKTKVKKLDYTYLVLRHKTKTYIEKRTAGIWQNLYQFPLMEHKIVRSAITDNLRSILKNDITFEVKSVTETTHLLSHRRISAYFYTIYLESKPIFLKNNIFEIELDELGVKYPISVLISNFLNKNTVYDK